MEQQLTISLKEYNILKRKADKWDALDEKISKMYSEEDNDSKDYDLIDVGEIAAEAFGYL